MSWFPHYAGMAISEFPTLCWWGLAVGITSVGNKRKEARVYCCKKKWKLF